MTQTRLDGAAKGAAANVRGKMLKQTRVQLAKKYPGREIRVELPNQRGFMQSRLYLVNGRMYMVMVVGTKGWVDSSDTKKFLDSFALTG